MLPPEDRRVRVVANPVAGGGRPPRVVPDLREALEAEGVPHEVAWTASPGDEEALAREAVKGGATHVVAVGGDGTVSGCAEALVRRNAALVVVPAGSGNDFARAVGVPEDPRAAARAAARGPTRDVDVGRMGEGCFANGLGLGLDGAIAHRVAASSRLSGEMGYLLGAIREAATFEPFRLAVETPGGRVEGETLLAGASNGPAHGGGFRVAPGARVDDGLLEAYRFGNVGVLSRLRHLPRVRAGEHGDLDVFSQEGVERVAFELEEAVPAHADGEVLTLEPGRHEVTVEPGALGVAVPPDG